MFIPRHPVIEDQFCQYGSQTSNTTGVGGVLCYAGSVVRLDEAAANQESIVKKMIVDDTEAPFGFSMQKVKTGYHSVHPAGFSMPGDLGSSDVIAQPSYDANGNISGTKAVPVGVAHLGIWDTVHYTCTMVASVVQANLVPGTSMYAANDEAKLTNNATKAADAIDLTTGECCEASPTTVAKVLKGVSLAKAQANINNTTLYPIRVKLMV